MLRADPPLPEPGAPEPFIPYNWTIRMVFTRPVLLDDALSYFFINTNGTSYVGRSALHSVRQTGPVTIELDAVANQNSIVQTLLLPRGEALIDAKNGEITLTDIVKELEKPARDPREDMPRPILRSDVLDMKDLKPGMVLKGTVRNVIDFGVFVDIGVHQDGLVHISQITDRFIKHPLEAVSVGDIVDVKVLDVDPVKKRIGLTMRLDQK